MKLQQLRSLVEIVRHGMNISAAAEAMHVAQPGISHQLKNMEQELGLQLFERHGKRLAGLTDPGQKIHAIAARILADVAGIHEVGKEFSDSDAGSMIIATTHTQARYVLPDVIKAFSTRYPHVSLHMHQGNPSHIAGLVASGEADLAIATEAIELHPGLATIPCYSWNRCLVVPPDHPLADVHPITLEAIAAFPLITYDDAFAGRAKMNEAFEEKGLSPDFVLTAMDSDVIKTYVNIGLGIGILASRAYDTIQDSPLKAIDIGHLFEPSTTHLGFRKSAFLRGFVYDFIERLSPTMTRDRVNALLHNQMG